jgi:succinate dehydrogenase / fumarate reductase cytochrome b subunit
MAAITSFLRTVTYRGGEGQLAWMLHRITGVGVFVFLALHIIDIFLMAFGPAVFDAVLFFYHQWVFKLAIVFGLYPAVVYHGLNGIRVVMIDFWPNLGKRQARLFRAQIAVFLILYIPSAIAMLLRMFGPHA